MGFNNNNNKKKKNKMSLIKVEAFLRLCASLALFIAALVVVLDSETQVVFASIKETANYKLATIAKMFVYVHFIGAGYSLIQFIRCLVAFTTDLEERLTSSSHVQKWGVFLIDQVTVYMVFSTNCAITEIGFLVLNGAEALQWMKFCDKFSRFCVQIIGGVFSGLIAFLLLFLISGLSTFNLFRWYSPKYFCLKPNKIGAIREQ